ncbi:hypothetical protein FG91_02607 [Sphingopyxis sp. LC81]|uniref:hypothetical protein n=1 Tax=Sphingopyxis sp. LC81 TaxID=1502850 RepID=UPI00050E6965|nr:hypothetical protein [Sphingopyxis sp. LC81]KGB53618.1 hypothetical protein FG91_02607 [Sphingopyxis sp. LC81]
MIALFNAELLRFRVWIIGATIGHLAWLIFLDRVADPMQQPLQVVQIYAGLLAAIGALFGAFQFSAYARQAAWIDLLHRPLAPRRIGGALLLAGLVIAALVVALPAALLLAFHHLTGGSAVETRHLLLPVAGWTITGIGYCIGAHLRIGAPRFAWASLLLLVWIHQSQAFGPGAVLLQLIALSTAMLLALGDVRPDRGRHDFVWHRWSETLLAGFAIGIAGTFALRFLMQLAMMMIGTHPLNGIPPPGGLVEAVRSDGQELIVAGLDQSDPQQRFWAEQATLSEVVTTGPDIGDPSQRYSLANPGDNVIVDGPARLEWHFDHGRMRYRAMDQRTRRPAHEAPLAPLLQVPPVSESDGKLIVAGNRLLTYAEGERRFFDRIALPPGERLIAAPQPAWDRLALLSNNALRIYDARVIQRGDLAFPVIATVPFPHAPAGLARVDMLELLDGYLVSFTFGSKAVEGFGRPEQQIWLVEADRQVHVATRSLGYDYPAAMRHLDLWFAPAINVAGRSAARWLAASNPLADRGPRYAPDWIYALGIVVHFLSALAGWLRSYRLGQAPSERTIWALACMLLGPAMLAAQLLACRRRRPC